MRRQHRCLFFESKGIVHSEFIPANQTVNQRLYVGICKRKEERQSGNKRFKDRFNQRTLQN